MSTKKKRSFRRKQRGSSRTITGTRNMKRKHCLGRSKLDCLLTNGCNFQKKPISNKLSSSNCVPKYCTNITDLDVCKNSNECLWDNMSKKCIMTDSKMSDILKERKKKYTKLVKTNREFYESRNNELEAKNRAIDLNNAKKIAEEAREKLKKEIQKRFGKSPENLLPSEWSVWNYEQEMKQLNIEMNNNKLLKELNDTNYRGWSNNPFSYSRRTPTPTPSRTPSSSHA